MLDECKGEKFEEVMCAFAIAVLSRFALARNGPSFQLACSDRLGEQQKLRILPSILAHRSILQLHLKHREEIQDKAEIYGRLLDIEQTNLETRYAALATNAVCVTAQELDATSQLVKDAWVGDERWAQVILGQTPRCDNGLLGQSFEIGWDGAQKGEEIQMNTSTLLDDLNKRITIQETRLKRWQTFQASLQNAIAAEDQVVMKELPQRKRSLTLFDKHLSLNLPTQSSARELGVSIIPSEPVHRSLLQSMRDELASLRTHHAADVLGPQHRLDGKEKDLPDGTCAENTGVKPRKLPCGENSTIGSCFKPGEKAAPVDGLESFLNPVTNGIGVANFFTASSTPPAVRGICSPFSETALKTYTDIDRDALILGATNSDHTFGPRMDFSACTSSNDHPHDTAFVNVLSPQQSSARDEAHVVEEVETLDGEQDPVSREATPTDPETPSKSHKSSSAIRTKSRRSTSSTEEPRLPQFQESTPSDYKFSTLLERTRQSMSLLHNPPVQTNAQVSQKSMISKQLRHSQIFPVNQFETPRGPRLKSPIRAPKDTPKLHVGSLTPRKGSGSSTPRDQLFSEEADYASVFKSRPRIALSPALSPDRSDFGLDLGVDSILKDKLDDLTLGNGDDIDIDEDEDDGLGAGYRLGGSPPMIRRI